MTSAKTKQSKRIQKGWCAQLHDRFQKGTLPAWHIGLILAMYNTAIMTVFAVVGLVAYWYIALWIYLLLGIPLFYIVFWLWCAQRIRIYYPRISMQKTLVIAKFSIFPFMIAFVLCMMNLAGLSISYGNIDNSMSGALYYNGALFSSGALFLGLICMVFGVRHPFRR